MHKYLIQQEVRANLQTPWPIALDENLDVVSGLGPDDGARLVGFQVAGVQSIVVSQDAFRANPTTAVGLEPVFSGGGGIYVMQGKIRTASEVTRA